MHKKMKKLLIYTILVIFTSCTVLNNTTLTSSESNHTMSKVIEGCIQPSITFSYDVNRETDTDWKNLFPSNVLPSAPWVFVSDLPPNTNNGGDIEVSYANSDFEEIWIRNRGYESAEVSSPFFVKKFTEYWIYETKTDQWKSASAITADGNAIAYNLFSLSDGKLWASNIPIETESPSVIPVLSTYDREQDKFISVPNLTTTDISVIFEANNTQPYLILPNLNRSAGKDILYWVLVQGDGIYSYQTSSSNEQKLLKQLDFANDKVIQSVDIDEEYIKNAYVAPDNSIYFTLIESKSRFESGSINTETIQNYPLFQFDLETNTVRQIIAEIDSFPVYSNVLIDSFENLWLDSLGWKDENESWHQIIQPPIFIAPAREFPFSSRMSIPNILLESKDGKIWFQHFNGMISLDPLEGEWCWFTTYQSDIVEDSDHNLWMIAAGKLYKNPLGE